MAHGPGPIELRTARLLLRGWRAADREPFAALNADPVVMRHFPATLDRDASDSSVDRFQAQLAASGWGFWAVELLETAEFLGFVGLQPLGPDLPIAPGVEIGWRLARRFWGRGYAPEAARAALDFAFDRLGLAEVVAFTSEDNQPSRRVMEKIGMRHDPRLDFDHPRVPLDWSGRRHVVYVVDAEGYAAVRGRP